MELEIKVTRIAKRWHARLMIEEHVRDEMACELQEDIGWICREMLRGYSKLGGCSPFAEAARTRHIIRAKGRTWGQKELHSKKKHKDVGRPLK